MTFEEIIVNSIIPVLSVLSAVWWLGRKIGDAATKDDLLQLKTELKDDMVRQEESLSGEYRGYRHFKPHPRPLPDASRRGALLANRESELLQTPNIHQNRHSLRTDNIRLEGRMKADNISLEERLTERIGRVEAKADRAIELAIANEGKLLSLTEKSDYIVRQVERIEARQYQQLTAAAIDVEEEN